MTPQNRQAVNAMAMATRSFRSGHLPMEAYHGQAVAFWTAMGMPTLVPGGAPAIPGVLPPTAASAPPVGPAAAATGGSAHDGPSLADQLAELGRLRDAGVLTDTEFEAAKARLIGG